MKLKLPRGPSKHLRNNINNSFTRAIILNAFRKDKTRKNLKTPYVALWKPDLNEQKDLERLVLHGAISIWNSFEGNAFFFSSFHFVMLSFIALYN